jgi:hypothetical protein
MLPKVLRAALLLTALVCGNVGAAESAVVRLQKRLQATSPDAVNAYLDTEAGWKRDGLPFFAQVKRCDLAAVKLMLALTKSTNASATQGNNDLLELAMGRCPELLLPLVPLDSIPRLCAVDAWAESKAKLATPSEQIAEIERRVGSLNRSKPTASSENGKSCLSSYAAKREQLGRAQ